jgi:general L-amino acid transport system permease protein
MRADAPALTRLFYDLRVRAVVYQVVAVAVVVLVGFTLFSNVSQKLATQNIATGFGFLDRQAGFVISQTFIDYKPSDTYARALLVGITNTVWVSIWGVVLATVLGLAVGIARLARNPLLAFLALLYVEALRNVPLLLYLFLWYALIVTSLPAVRDAWEVLPHVFLSNSGLAVPSLGWSAAHSGVLAALALGAVLAVLIGKRLQAQRVRTGREARRLALRRPGARRASRPGLPRAAAGPRLEPAREGPLPPSGRAQLKPEFTALLVGLALSPPPASPRSSAAASSPSARGNGKRRARWGCGKGA